MVKAVPFLSGFACFVTKVDNKGESIITTIPQNNKKAMSSIGDEKSNRIGESKQQIPDEVNANTIVFLSVIFSDKYPPIMQAILPIPIIKKDNRDMLRYV